MSVLFLECPEEFPELVELWRKSFAETATAHPTSEAPLRTTPLNIDVIDCDDPRCDPNPCSDLQDEFTMAVVPTQTTPSGSGTPTPNVTCYTMEDGGESKGARATSALAAALLAEANYVPAPVASPEEDEDDPAVMAREITRHLQAATGLDRYRKFCLTPGGC